MSCLAATQQPRGARDGTMGVWQLADGTPVRQPLTGHTDGVQAVGALTDGTLVIVSGGDDGTVRVWRLADGASLRPPLWLPGAVRHIAMNGAIIVTAVGVDIAIHQPAFLQPVH